MKVPVATTVHNPIGPHIRVPNKMSFSIAEEKTEDDGEETTTTVEATLEMPEDSQPSG